MIKQQKMPVPQWMLKIQLREEEPRPEAEAEFQRQLMAARVIEADSHKFRLQLLDQLELAVAALPALGLTGSIVRRAVSARVAVRRPGSGADFRSVGLSLAEKYVDGNLAEDHYRLTFVLAPDFAVAVCDQAADDTPLNPEQAAEHIFLRLLSQWIAGPVK